MQKGFAGEAGEQAAAPLPPAARRGPAAAPVLVLPCRRERSAAAGTAGSPRSRLPGFEEDAGVVGRHVHKSLNLKNNTTHPKKRREKKNKQPRSTKRRAVPPGSAQAAASPPHPELRPGLLRAHRPGGSPHRPGDAAPRSQTSPPPFSSWLVEPPGEPGRREVQRAPRELAGVGVPDTLPFFFLFNFILIL